MCSSLSNSIKRFFSFFQLFTRCRRMFYGCFRIIHQNLSITKFDPVCKSLIPLRSHVFTFLQEFAKKKTRTGVVTTNRTKSRIHFLILRTKRIVGLSIFPLSTGICSEHITSIGTNKSSLNNDFLSFPLRTRKNHSSPHTNILIIEYFIRSIHWIRIIVSISVKTRKNFIIIHTSTDRLT